MKLQRAKPTVPRQGSLARTLIFIASLACLPISSVRAEVIDYLGVPGPIVLGNHTYSLAWSAHPSAQYVKQEYLPTAQTPTHYEQMLLVERLQGNITVKDAVRAQLERLSQRLHSDSLLNMSMIDNPATGETLLDFIVSGKGADGEMIVEWNAYRYAPLKREHGGGVLLFGDSRRAYGDDNAAAFLKRLKHLRPDLINALAGAPLPRPSR